MYVMYVCLYVGSHCEKKIGTLFCVPEGVGNLSRYFKMSIFFYERHDSFIELQQWFFVTLFANFSLESCVSV
jgi:hypothetical protein